MAKSNCNRKPKGRRLAKRPPASTFLPAWLRWAKKVLVVDLDPQGNTTSGYGVAKKRPAIQTFTPA